VATEGRREESADEATGERTDAGGAEPGARNIVLRPYDWNPMVAAALVFVAVVVVLGLVVLLLIGAFSSSGETTTTSEPLQVVLSPRLKQVSTCLQVAGVGVTTDGLDFVAGAAPGGALKAPMSGNVVTVSDGLAPAGSVGIVHGYERLSGSLDLKRLLSRQGRFALLWAKSPTRLEARTVRRCLS
jgi:hypothetical protein